MKDIFKEEMPTKPNIQNGEMAESAPEKVIGIISLDNGLLDSLNYDNTHPGNSKTIINLEHTGIQE